MLLYGNGQRQRRVDPFDSCGDEPAGRERLRTLHVPSARRSIAEAGFERIVHPLTGKAGMPKRQLRFNGRDRRVAIVGRRWALAGAHPPTPCYRRTDSETNEWRNACADDHIAETRRVWPRWRRKHAPQT